MRPRTRALRPPWASRHAFLPSTPSRSATAPPGSCASSPSERKPEALELRVAIRRHREQRERKRLEERLFLLRRDEEDLTRTRDARRREGGEAPLGGADARIPGRADRRERALERRLHAAVEALDALRLEHDRALLDRLDGEARVLETPQDALPLPLDRSRVAIDEDERRARRERLPEAHPRLHACRLGRRGDRPEQRLLARLRRERRRDEREPRPRTQRRSQLEPGNEETRDHSNTCSIRTYVLLSSRPPRSIESADARIRRAKSLKRDRFAAAVLASSCPYVWSRHERRLGLDAGRHRPRPHPRARRRSERRVLQGRPRAARHPADLGGRERRAAREPRRHGRRADDERPGAHRVRRRLARAGRRVPPRWHRGRRHGTTAPRASASSTARPRAAATTRPSCSTPTATTSRPSAASSELGRAPDRNPPSADSGRAKTPEARPLARPRWSRTLRSGRRSLHWPPSGVRPRRGAASRRRGVLGAAASRPARTLRQAAFAARKHS